MPQLKPPTPSVSPAAPAQAPAAPATAAPEAAQAATLGNQETQARMNAAPAPAESSLLAEDSSDAITHEVSERVTQTISNAPDPHGAWNGTFGWDSNFQLVIDPSAKTCTIVVRIHTGASDEVKAKWAAAIEGKWGGKYCLNVAPDKDGKGAASYRILCDLQWVDDAKDAHYEVTANTPGADEGGRAGLGGTTSMLGWGTEDEVDVTHEFGHMMGAVDDYFTTNGHDHTHGGTTDGFRDEGGGIMNAPNEDPFVEHYDLVRQHAAKALKVDASRCTVG
jgi:hypothetical protein